MTLPSLPPRTSDLTKCLSAERFKLRFFSPLRSRSCSHFPNGSEVCAGVSTAATRLALRVPFGKTARDSLYRLIDAFTLLHLRWGFSRGATQEGTSWWIHRRSTPPGVAWSGYAFENVCLSHVTQIKQALGISGILTEHSAWYHRSADRTDSGAQIDLIVDRPDDVVNLCEMKYSNAPFVIDKKYANTLRDRSEIFRRVTRTHKSLFITFVTVHGVSPGTYASELVASEVRADALFASG